MIYAKDVPVSESWHSGVDVNQTGLAEKVRNLLQSQLWSTPSASKLLRPAQLGSRRSAGLTYRGTEGLRSTNQSIQSANQ